MHAFPTSNGNGRHPAHGTPPSSNRIQDLPEHAAAPPPDGSAAAPEPAPEPTEKWFEGRDKRGHFNLGNPGSPGNPYARQVAALRKAMLATVTAEDIRAVAQALLARAKEGDSAAARLLRNVASGAARRRQRVGRIPPLRRRKSCRQRPPRWRPSAGTASPRCRTASAGRHRPARAAIRCRPPDFSALVLHGPDPCYPGARPVSSLRRRARP